MDVAALQGSKHKYVGMEDDEEGKHTDIVKDKATGQLARRRGIC